jgi:hypothetical protein
MVFLPQDPLRLLIGNNDFGQMPITFIASDIGYVRMIHGFGLLGMLTFLFGVYVIPIAGVYLKRKRAQLTCIDNLNEGAEVFFLPQFTLVVFLFGLIAHWKIIYLSSRIYLFVLFVLVSLTFLRINSIQKSCRYLAGTRNQLGQKT